MTVVRIAVPKDYDALMVFTREMWADNGFFSYDETKVSKLVISCLNREKGVIGVIEEDKNIVASTCLMLEQHWYTEDWSLGDRWIYVRETHRHSKYVEDLVDFGKSLSDRWGLPFVFGVFSASRAEAKVRLFKQMAPIMGGAFLYRGETPAGE